jgi:hypothetical protein
MKLIVQIFALSVVLAGAAAASVSAPNAHVLPNHQAAPSLMPLPTCGPHMPGCSGSN